MNFPAIHARTMPREPAHTFFATTAKGLEALLADELRALGATEVEVVGDSELIAKQVRGLYKVKHAAMRPLHREAVSALGGFEAWQIRTVPRAQNADADALVNAALDQAAAAAAR